MTSESGRAGGCFWVELWPFAGWLAVREPGAQRAEVVAQYAPGPRPEVRECFPALGPEGLAARLDGLGLAGADTPSGLAAALARLPGRRLYADAARAAEPARPVAQELTHLDLHDAFGRVLRFRGDPERGRRDWLAALAAEHWRSTRPGESLTGRPDAPPGTTWVEMSRTRCSLLVRLAAGRVVDVLGRYAPDLDAVAADASRLASELRFLRDGGFRGETLAACAEEQLVHDAQARADAEARAEARARFDRAHAGLVGALDAAGMPCAARLIDPEWRGRTGAAEAVAAEFALGRGPAWLGRAAACWFAGDDAGALAALAEESGAGGPS